MGANQTENIFWDLHIDIAPGEVTYDKWQERSESLGNKRGEDKINFSSDKPAAAPKIQH